MSRTERMAVSLAAFLLAVVAGQAIYVYFIVPELPSLSAVPIHWWALMYCPMIAVCGWVGWQSESYKTCVAFGGLAAVLESASAYLFWVLRQPGHMKPPEFLLIDTAVWAAFFVVVTSFLRFSRSVALRVLHVHNER